MEAATFDGFGNPLIVREVPRPAVDPAGALISVEACGVCRSDWHAWMGDWQWRGVDPEPGHVFGHEPAGRIVEVGQRVERHREGDHVAIPFNLGDGTCDLCRNGHANICRNRLGLGLSDAAQGAWAEYVHVPDAEHNLVTLPEGVSSVDMAGLGCRFMTSFHALAHRADPTAGDWLAVHGCGGIGLSAVQIGNALGMNVIAVDLDAEKLSLAKELGAVDTVNAAETDDVPDAIRGLTDGGADVSVDGLGIPETARNSILCLDKLGTHVQIGLTTKAEAGEIEFPSDRIVLNEIDVVGSLGMQPTRYDEIFRMMRTEKVRPGDLISERISLQDISRVLDDMTSFETVGIPVVTEF